jgi:hypothetical protein
MTERAYQRAPTVEKALTVTTDTVAGRPVSTTFRYFADRALVCELKLPCDINGQISPDGVVMLIAYLTRLVGGYGDTK